MKSHHLYFQGNRYAKTNPLSHRSPQEHALIIIGTISEAILVRISSLQPLKATLVNIQFLLLVLRGPRLQVLSPINRLGRILHKFATYKCMTIT